MFDVLNAFEFMYKAALETGRLNDQESITSVLFVNNGSKSLYLHWIDYEHIEAAVTKPLVWLLLHLILFKRLLVV